MRIMTYNILDGAQNTIDQVVEVITAISPDILTINEANGFEADNQAKLKMLAQSTSMPYYFLALCGDGYIYHTAILSRYPILSTTVLQPSARAVIVSKVEVNKKIYQIASVHLSPFSEEKRVDEVKRLLTYVQGTKNVIISGDLNSLSPLDEYPEDTVSKMNEGQLRKFTREGVIQYQVLSSLYSAGFTDCAKQENGSYETTVPTKVDYDPEHFQNRLDYILLSSDIADDLIAYEVVKNNLTDFASDHYPVYVDIN